MYIYIYHRHLLVLLANQQAWSRNGTEVIMSTSQFVTLYVVFDVSSPCWFLVMTLLFVILRQKKIDKQNCEYHSCKTCHKSFEEIGGDQSVLFPWDAVKSAHYDSKGCCSNSILFLMCILNVGFW